MRIILSLLLCSVLFNQTGFTQTLTAERSAELMPGGYDITGDAFLRAYDDGSLQLDLSADFATPEGPDVWIYLNNDNNITNGLPLVNLVTIDHFSGALSIDVPENIDIEDYDRVVFWCVAFNQNWASGTLGETTTFATYECQEHATATTDWVAQVELCANDGIADEIELRNSIGVAPGEHYAFLLTDENEIVLAAIYDTLYNVEGSGEQTTRVYGINYDGELNVVVGANRSETTATGCYTHSSADLYLTIQPTAACVSATFDAALTQAVKVFPVPVRDAVTIELPTGFQSTTVRLLDAIGRTYLLPEVPAGNRLQVDLGQFATGTYFLQLHDGSRAVTKQLRIER